MSSDRSGMSKGRVAVARCHHHRQRQGPDFTKVSARAVPLKRAQSKMNRQMQMRKDEFRTDDEKDAWQQGYIASIEVLKDLHQDLPENLHGALCAGWWCAFEDATRCRR